MIFIKSASVFFLWGTELLLIPSVAASNFAYRRDRFVNSKNDNFSFVNNGRAVKESKPLPSKPFWIEEEEEDIFFRILETNQLSMSLSLSYNHDFLDIEPTLPPTTIDPSARLSIPSTRQPSFFPTDTPTIRPSSEASDVPSSVVSGVPSVLDSDRPTSMISDEPTSMTSDEPSISSSDSPSVKASNEPTSATATRAISTPIPTAIAVSVMQKSSFRQCDVPDSIDNTISTSENRIVSTVTFQYAGETSSSSADFVSEIEENVLDTIASQLLNCPNNGDNRALRSGDRRLAVLQIAAQPADAISTTEICSPSDATNTCTVVDAAMTLTMENDDDVNEMKRSALVLIQESMNNGSFISDPPGNLVKLSYLGPDPQTIISKVELNEEKKKGFFEPKVAYGLMGVLLPCAFGVIAFFLIQRSNNCNGPLFRRGYQYHPDDTDKKNTNNSTSQREDESCKTSQSDEGEFIDSMDDEGVENVPLPPNNEQFSPATQETAKVKNTRRIPFINLEF